MNFQLLFDGVNQVFVLNWSFRLFVFFYGNFMNFLLGLIVSKFKKG